MPTIAIDVGVRAEEIVQKLADKGLMAGFGDFYSVRLLKALRVDLPVGVLRLSFVHYTSSDEVSSMIQALDEIL